MSCNCKHEKKQIKEEQELLDLFKMYFVRRMTVDNSSDRRRRDYNQSIFGKWEEDDDKPSNYSQMWTEMTMDMVLQCFDDAKKDFAKRFCDEHTKTIFERGFEND